MNRIKIVLSYVIGFISATLLVGLILLLIAKFTILNKNYVNRTLEKYDYYEKVNKEINEEMELQLLSSGFTNEILENVYTKDEIFEDINLFIDNAYQGKLIKFDKSNVRQNIEVNIDNYFKKTKLTVINKQDLSNFVSDLVLIYENEIGLYHLADSIVIKISKIEKIVNISIIVVCILLVSCILIFLLYIKTKIFNSILISSGLIILFIRLFVFEKIDVDYLLIITENFSEILRNLLNNFIDISLIISLILIIIGIFTLIYESMCKPKKKKLLFD